MASTGCSSLPIEAGELLDARGLKCPLPVLKAEKRLAELPPGATLVVLASDPIAKIDIPLFCMQQGHQCTTSQQEGSMRFVIVKAAA